MKKRLFMILALCLTLGLSIFGLTACDEHTHSYSDSWAYNETHHWHPASCGCEDKISCWGEHDFSEGLCICGTAKLSAFFTSGAGTEANPYIISNADELANIAQATEFTYFKVADGVQSLDLTNWTAIRLNGSFDGNNVVLNNLTTRLFTHIGNNEEKEIYVKNFEANINLVSTGSAALIKEIDNFGTTTFENVKIHGYIEGESNMATLFNFGTQNGHATGSNYTVELKNVKIDATLVCVTAQPVGAIVAHAFAGTGNKLTLKVDSATEFTGEVYSAGDKKYNEYVSIGTYEIIKDGQAYTQSEIDAIQITKVQPVKGTEGYTVTVGENVTKIAVSITTQLTAYDEDGNKIAKLVGITLTLDTKYYTENLTGDIKILDLFESAEIVNGASEYDAEIVDGVLKLYVAQSANYATGFARLQVQQYNAQNEIVSCGTLNVHEFTK